MTVQALLASKERDHEVKTVGPRLRIETVAALLRETRVGAFPVVDTDGRLVGIISERDIVAAVGVGGSEALNRHTEEFMTRNVATVTPRDSIKEVMQIMIGRRIRHLPVVEDGKLVDVISMRDVVKQRIDAVEMERDILRDYALSKQ